MARTKGSVSYTKGYRKRLMQMLLTSGVVTYRGLRLWSEDEREYEMYKRRVQGMNKEGITESLRFDKQTVIRLSKSTSEYAEYQMRYGPVGEWQLADTNRIDIGLKTEDAIAKPYRAMREAEVLMFLNEVGVETYIGVRKDLYALESADCGYYTARELKKFTETNIEMDTRKINSRAHGMFVSSGGNYLMYHTGSSLIKYSAYTEMQMEMLVNRLLHTQGFTQKAAMVVLGYNEDVFCRLMRSDEKQAGYISADSTELSYPMYMIPYDGNGVAQMRMMQIEGWEEQMMSATLSPECRVGATPSYDGVGSDGTHYLTFLIPDLRKLKRFLSGAAWTEPEKNIIYCLSYQKSFLEKVTNHAATIKVVGDL